MSEHTNHQILRGSDGSPTHAVIPYSEYLELFGPEVAETVAKDEPTIPHEVAGLCLVNGFSIIRAWREHLGFTQKEAAERIGVSQSAFAQMEKSEGSPRVATLKKIADAFGIKLEQLQL